MNKKLGIGIGIVVVAIVAVAIFSGCIELGTPELEVYELSANSPKIFLDDSGTAHDVSIECYIWKEYRQFDTPVFLSYEDATIDSIKSGEAVRFKVTDPLCDTVHLRYGVGDLTGKVSISSKEGRWSQTFDAEWLRELCEHWIFPED
jgi:hypothetical protein